MTNRMELLNNIKTNMEDIIRTLKKYDIETLFSLYDLKLHDVVFMENFNENIFESMCLCEYDNFNEYLSECNCKLEYLGRTSKFWIISEYSRMTKYDLDYTLSYGLNYKVELLVNTFLDEYISNSLEITYINSLGITIETNIDKDFTFTYNDNITDIDWYNTEELEELTELLADYKKDLQEFIEYNVIKPLEVIEYINDFKKNQELIYNEYAEDIE